MFLLGNEAEKMKKISKHILSLGEGCCYSPSCNYISWVDINNRKIYLSNLSSEDFFVFVFDLNSTPSAIFEVTSEYAIILDDIGIIRFNFENKSPERLYEASFLSGNDSLRGNDGIFLDGVYYFGTMEFDPKLNSGGLYTLSNSGIQQFDNISIPNTFIPFNNGLLISDSMTQQIYHYEFGSFVKTLWCDLSNTNMTPDGGCIDSKGRIFICMWGASCIAEFDSMGVIVRTIPVPAQNPTNCCPVNDKLLVTSASIEIISENETLENGHTFLVEV